MDATATPDTTSTKARIYPWVMAAMALTVLMITNGMTTTGITAFDESILKEFGWKRGEFKFRDLVTLITAGLLAPLAGYFIDKIGVRTLLLFGSALLAVLYYLYGKISSLTELYLIHAGFGLVLVCAGLNIAVVMSSQWFIKARGTAIGIALVGSSLGGVVFPPIILALLPAHGWREAFALVGLASVLLFILAFFLVRSPTELNIGPLGLGQPLKGAGRPPSPDDLTYQQAIRTVSFWALTFVAMASFYSILSLALHLFLHMRGLGFDAKTAGGAMGLLFGLGLFSKFLFGFLSDILSPKLVFRSNVALMVIGLVLMATQNRDFLWAGIAITGFGWGGLYTLIQYQAVNNFGVTHTGKILGTITMLDAIAGGLGIWLTGVMFDKFGSYNNAFWVFVVLMSAAFLASFLVKREIKN
ncbi:MAG: MFS transporter [Burkholderiales bacterium]|jgi:predicted MFS family arabinose efflux permease|nr:MFS transporter [Nitrosomonadaceae bacterium]